MLANSIATSESGTGECNLNIDLIEAICSQPANRLRRMHVQRRSAAAMERAMGIEAS